MATRLDDTETGKDQDELFEDSAGPPPPTAGSRRRHRAWLVVGLVLAVSAGFGLARLAGPADGGGSPQARTPEPPPITSPDDVGRVAAVAEAVAPTVVQLESGSGLGSGVIYDTSGLILTAAHVVSGSESVDVRLADGRLFRGMVIGAHHLTDVAVVQVFGASDLPVAVLGYGSPIRVGELAVALGSPFGFDQTVTAGIVSAVNRTVNGVPMVQTDAAINPGNSGGPLVDGSGRVIGINDVIFTRGGGNDGIGFAISIDVAIVVADQLTAGDDVQLAVLGVNTIPSTTGEGGAIIREVLDGSPAAHAGLEVGDRIVAVDDEPITEPTTLFAAVVTRRAGTEVTVTYVRDGERRSADVVLVGIEI